MIRKIRNNATGEIKEVDDSQLGNYGLSAPAETTPSTTTTGLPDIEQTQQKSSLEIDPVEHYKAYENAKAAGDTKAAADLYKRFTDATDYQKANATTPSSEGETKLRTEFTNMAKTNGWFDIKNSYDKIKAAPEDSAGDLSLLYGYMKILDPGSAVREGEFATVDNSGSIPDSVRNAYNKAISGKRLNPNLRETFVNSATSLYNTQVKTMKQTADYYSSLASQQGADPKNVVGILGDLQEEKTTEKEKKSGLLSKAYNLTLKPIVQGLQQYGELVGTAGEQLLAGGATKLTEAQTKRLSELAIEMKTARENNDIEKMKQLAEESKKISGRGETLGNISQGLSEDVLAKRQQQGTEGSFDQGTLSGLKTVGIGALKGAAGVASATEIAAIVMSGGTSAAITQFGKTAVRNAMINAGLYGTGEALKAKREGGDVSEAFVKGTTGEGTTGIATGAFGENSATQTIDTALSIGLPILFGKQIDKATNKIVSSPKQIITQIKGGINTNNISQGLKNKAGEFLYNQGKDDVLAYVKPTKQMKKIADSKGIDIGDSIIARGLDDTPENNITALQEQNKIANSELVKMAKDKKIGIIIKKGDYYDIAEELKKTARSNAEKLALDKWANDNAKSLTVKNALTEKRIAGKSGYNKTGNIKQQTISKADAQLEQLIRSKLNSNEVLGKESENLLKSMEEGILLEDVFRNTKISGTPTSLKDSIGRILNPVTFGKTVVGGVAEKVTGGKKFGFNVAKTGSKLQSPTETGLPNIPK